MNLIDARQTYDETERARESYARKIFAFDKIAAEIKQAAASGKTELRAYQEYPVGLATTDAAKQLIMRLSALSYQLTWEAAGHKETVGKRETLRVLRFYELVISWDTDMNCL